MADFLTQILLKKQAEIAALRPLREELERRASEAPTPRDFAGALTRNPKEVAVIAEIKRKSPSHPQVTNLDSKLTAKRYESGGAAAISVLTDKQFFAGELDDLTNARSTSHLPVLRKDFVLDELQVLESRANGADAVLLIATLPGMTSEHLSALRDLVVSYGMAALVEVHTDDDLELAIESGANVIGVNRRDLHSVGVDSHETIVDDQADKLIEHIPPESITVAMSSIKSRGDVESFGERGFNAVLVGRHIVETHPDEEQTLERLVGVRRR